MAARFEGGGGDTGVAVEGPPEAEGVDEGGRKRRFLNVESVKRRTFSLGEERAKLVRRGMRENFLMMSKESQQERMGTHPELLARISRQAVQDCVRRGHTCRCSRQFASQMSAPRSKRRRGIGAEFRVQIVRS